MYCILLYCITNNNNVNKCSVNVNSVCCMVFAGVRVREKIQTTKVPVRARAGTPSQFNTLNAYAGKSAHCYHFVVWERALIGFRYAILVEYLITRLYHCLSYAAAFLVFFHGNSLFVNLFCGECCLIPVDSGLNVKSLTKS